MIADTARLFLGLELNDEARLALNDVRKTLIEQGVPGKFHGAGLYHLTLCFLGSTPVHQIPSLAHLMNSLPCRPFALTLSGLGTFKNGSILWAGVESCDKLTDYQSRLAHALRKAGFPLEEGEYRPHITLARQVKSAVPEVIVPSAVFPVRHATLFESTRVDGELTYAPIYRSVFL